MTSTPRTKCFAKYAKSAARFFAFPHDVFCPLVGSKPDKRVTNAGIGCGSVGPAPYWVSCASRNTSESAVRFLAFAHDVFRPLVGSKPQINGMPHLA